MSRPRILKTQACRKALNSHFVLFWDSSVVCILYQSENQTLIDTTQCKHHTIGLVGHGGKEETKLINTYIYICNRFFTLVISVSTSSVSILDTHHFLFTNSIINIYRLKSSIYLIRFVNKKCCHLKHQYPSK